MENPERLSTEREERFRESVRAREVIAVQRKSEARASLKRLSASGCDVGALWSVLEFYRYASDHIFEISREQFKRFLRESDVVLRKLTEVATAISSAQRNKLSDYTMEGLGHAVGAWIGDLERARELGRWLANERGPLRSEKNLVLASTYLSVRMGRPCYKELADILDAVDGSKGLETEFNPDNIRRVCERYSRSVNAEKLRAEAEALFNGFQKDELTQILKTELLAAAESRLPIADAKVSRKS